MRILAVSIVVAAAVLVRVLAGGAFTAPDRFPDSADYITTAENILAGKGPMLNEHTVANRGPGYSYFLAGVFALGGGFAAASAVQALLGGLTCAAVFLIGRRLFGGRVGLAAAAITALDPVLTYFSGLVLGETLFAFLLAAGMLCMLYTERGNVAWAAAGGALMGLASLVRPSLVLMLPLLCVVWLLLRWRKPHSLRTAVIVCAVAFAVMLPWAARNHRLTGRFVFTTLSAGASLFEGTYPGADGGPAMDRIEREGAWPPEIEGKSEAEKDYILRRAAIGCIKDDPLRIVMLAPRKLWRLWNPVPNFSEYRSAGYMAISALYMLPVMACVLGGLLAARNRMRAAGVLLVPAFYFSALHTIFVGSVRYRAPVMPLLSVFAGVAVVAVIGFAWRARPRQGECKVQSARCKCHLDRLGQLPRHRG